MDSGRRHDSSASVAGQVGRGSAGRVALLLLLIVVWAISWPAVKVGVGTVPPIWYGCFRFAIAASCLFAYVAARHGLVLPSRNDWPLIAISGVLQMAAFSVLTGIALTILPPGRASVLAYSTPIWVAPLAAWWLSERISRMAMIGVGIGLLGILAIAAPSLGLQDRATTLAYALLIGAAATWAVSIVYVRAHKFGTTALALAPWQMLVAASFILPLAVSVEGRLPSIGWRGVASLVYVGPIATAFAYWAVVECGRRFRANTMSMALLAVPCLGIVISSLTLGETIDLSLVLGVSLVGLGIGLVTVANHAKTEA